MRPRKDRGRLSRPPPRRTPAPLCAPQDRESSGSPAGPGHERGMWGGGGPAFPPPPQRGCSSGQRGAGEGQLCAPAVLAPRSAAGTG